MALTRRQFLGTSAAAVVAAGTMAKGKVFGANERIRVACVGIHGRGGSHIGGFTALGGSEVVALCDPDAHVLEGRAKALEEKTGKKPKTYVDMRDLMADDSIDAVSFATPNHWHALGSIWACQAGKDVYVEKPMTHNVFEGRQLVAAAEEHGRVVLVGTQRRSDPGWTRAIQRLREGVIGEVYMARALCYKNRDSIGSGEPHDPPPHLDWTLWQGPAQERPYSSRYVHYNWHWFWDYGNGDIGNQGVHQMDVAVWGLGERLPVRVSSMGGRYTYEDQAETPNTQVATFRYDDGKMLVFEVRGRATNDEGGQRVGNLFYGSEGYMVGSTCFDKKNNEIPDEQGPGDDIWVNGNHFDTFLRLVRSRDMSKNPAPPRIGHVGAAHCHLANVAYRVEQQLEFDPDREKVTGYGSRKANKLLTRNYRKGFEVPKLA